MSESRDQQVREQVRRTASAAGVGSEKKHANPMEAWAENWRKATESFTASGDWTEAARKQAESVQKSLSLPTSSGQRVSAEIVCSSYNDGGKRRVQFNVRDITPPTGITSERIEFQGLPARICWKASVVHSKL